MVDLMVGKFDEHCTWTRAMDLLLYQACNYLWEVVLSYPLKIHPM
jgi:hypothetical protein